MKKFSTPAELAGLAQAGRPTQRRTGRVLLEGPGQTLLLFRFRSPERPADTRWLTPGGAAHPGENPQQTAARELREETGLQVAAAELGAPVAISAGEWQADGKRFAAHDTFFWLLTERAEIDLSGHEAHERTLVAGYRWWTSAELDSTSERLVPKGLASLMRQLRTAGPPAEPIVLPW
jgi:8-oxo-dGTP pyrophosphatase MutT (NUDIX family)